MSRVRSSETVEAPEQAESNIVETPLYQDLKQYRYETSKAEGVKAFYIFSNAQLEALIADMPSSLDELRKISGFGEVKCEKYGEAILGIVDNHRRTGV